jgi:hypothetical protein
MRRLVVLVVAACAHTPPPKVPPPQVATVPAAPVSPWAAVPVRVMTWTPRGVEQIGALPGTLPQPMPARWYVEPIAALDEAAFGRLVELVRADNVPGLSLRNQVVARWLGRLAELPALEALVLDGSDVDGAALAALDLPLRRLYLARTAIDDAAVATGVARFAALEVLDIEGTAVGDDGARAIAGLAELRAVNLAATRLTDEGGAALGALAKLEIADLGGTRVGAKTVAALRKLPLRELFLDHTLVRGEVATLAPLAPGLVRFDISATKHRPTDQELAWLASATGLVELGISGARVRDPLALALAKLPGLREVRMAKTAITNATVRALAARADLEEVDLGYTPVDDASAAALLAAPEMRILVLDSTPIGDAAFAGPAGPKLVELYASLTEIGDAATALLDRVPQLTALGLGRVEISDAALERIARLTALGTLRLSGVKVSPGALARLAALHRLDRLYLDDTRADDDVLAALAPACTTLRVLWLSGTDVSEDGLAALRAFGDLRELTIGDTRMRGGISDLSAWPRLHTLSLVGLDLGDAELPSLAAQPSLVALDLSATEIRDPSPLAALPRLRQLGVAQTRLSPSGTAALRRLVARGVEVLPSEVLQKARPARRGSAGAGRR